MSLAFLFAEIFERYQLPDAAELSEGALPAIAAKVRGSLKSRAKILKAARGCSHAEALETLARCLKFANWFECNRTLSGLEEEQPRLPSPDEANQLFSVLVAWPGPAATPGAEIRAAMGRRELAIHVVIAHAHGHALAKLLAIPLGEGLDLAARLHGAPNWDECVYGAPYWVAMAHR